MAAFKAKNVPACPRNINVNLRWRSSVRASWAELKIFQDNLGAVPLAAPVFRVPTARLDSALDEDWSSFFKILANDFRQAPKRDDIVKVRLLLFGSVLVLVDAVCGNCKLRYLRPAGERFKFRVARKIAVEKDFV